MKKPYSLTPVARNELREILRYYQRERNVAAARKVRASLEQAFDLLARHPDIGHPRLDLVDERHLVWAVRQFYVVYRPKSRPLEIVLVWHGARGKPPLV